MVRGLIVLFGKGGREAVRGRVEKRGAEWEGEDGAEQREDEVRRVGRREKNSLGVGDGDS